MRDMMLSWVQYAYGVFNGDVDSPAYWTVGPVTGPCVITEVRSVLSLNQFSNFLFSMSVVTSPDPTAANFNAGVRLLRAAAESSVASTDAVMAYAASGANPWTLVWPCWVPVPSRPAWVCFWADRTGGAANMRSSHAVRAERLWPDGTVPPESSPAGAKPVASPLEVLRARARRG